MENASHEIEERIDQLSEIQILTQGVHAILAKLNQDDDAHINAAKIVMVQLNRIEEKIDRLLGEKA